MKHLLLLCVATVVVLTGCESVQRQPRIPPRTVGVSAGPEQVFERPVEEVVPQLVGAMPTGMNGRVGPELVFWSYRLSDGRPVLFYACADLEGVQCSERAARVCPAGKPDVLYAGSAEGRVRKLDCEVVAQAHPGDLRPNCIDTQFSNMLLLGLVSCP